MCIRVTANITFRDKEKGKMKIKTFIFLLNINSELED